MFRNWTAIWFALPAISVLVLVLAGPMVYSFRDSFTAWSLLTPGSANIYVGFQNYLDALADPDYHQAVITTIKYAVSSVALDVVVGTAFALMLNSTFYGRAFLRSVIIIPMVLTPAAVGLFWIVLYDQDFGVFNYLLGLLGIQPVAWLGTKWALCSIIILEVWQSTPFFTLVLLAGLQSLDDEIVDAARVDGANSVQVFYYLTLPHMVPYLMIASAFRIIGALGDFDKIYMLTGGGPGVQTTNLTQYTYQVGFNNFDMGKTSALSWLFVVIVLIMSSPFMYSIGRRQDAGRE